MRTKFFWSFRTFKRFYSLPKFFFFKFKRFDRNNEYSLNYQKMTLFGNINLEGIVSDKCDDSIDKKRCVYELFGIIDVSGENPDFCRYRAIVKKKVENTDFHDQYEFGNSYSKKVSQSQVLENFTPYMLFYRPLEIQRKILTKTKSAKI